MGEKSQKLNLESIAEDSHKGHNILSTVKRELKGYLSDTSASLMFYSPLLGANEYFIVGLEPNELLKTRLGMGFAALFIARPYGKFREFWAKTLKTTPKSSGLRKFVTDVSCNLLFYSPVYSFMMYRSGASLKEIGVALPISMLIPTLLARPYGWFFDKWRKIWGLKPILDKESKETE